MIPSVMKKQTVLVNRKTATRNATRRNLSTLTPWMLAVGFILTFHTAGISAHQTKQTGARSGRTGGLSEALLAIAGDGGRSRDDASSDLG